MTSTKIRPFRPVLPLLFASPLACDAPSHDPPLPPISGDVALHPLPEPTQPDDVDAPNNPWIAGFGGEGSVQGGDSEPDALGAPSADKPPGVGSGAASDPLEPRGEAPDTPAGLDEPGEAPRSLPERRLVRYLEGEGSDKLLTIQGTPGTTSFACVVEIYSNGGTSPWRSVSLPSTFPDSGELVLCSLPDLRPECAESMSGSLYNGNDALVLACDGAVLDSFGRVGEDPGVAWASLDGVIRSEGQDLVRCGEGLRSDPTSPFVLEGEWIRAENGESPEAARVRCGPFGAFGMGGAGEATPPQD